MNSHEKQNKRPKPPRKGRLHVDYSACPKWMKEFYLNSMSINGSKCPIKLDHVMERYLEQFRKEFTGKFVRGLSPAQAAAICQQMNKQLIFFYNYFSDIKELFVVSQFYDNMVEMLAIYFQLEMKSSNRYIRGRDTDHFICVRIMSLLWVFFAGHEEHMFHTLLKTPNFAKRYKGIFDPIFQKLLIKHKPRRTLTDLEYIRNLLTFKLWKRLFTVREKHAVTKLALTQLRPPKSFMSNGWKYKFLPIINFTRSIDIHIHLTTAFLDLDNVIKDYFNYLEKSSNYFQYDFGAEKKSFISDLRESLTQETNDDNLTDNLTDYLIDQFLMVPIKDQISTTSQDDDDLILTYCSTVSKLQKPRVTGVIDLTEDESSDSVEHTPSASQAQSEIQSVVEIIEINDEPSVDEESNESEEIPLNCHGSIPVTVIGDFTMLEDNRLVLTEITDTAQSIQYEVVTTQITENNTASTSAILEHMDSSSNGEYARLTVIPCVLEQVEDIVIENTQQLTNNNVVQTDETTVVTELQMKPININNPTQKPTDYYNDSDRSLKINTVLNEHNLQDETILQVNSTSPESKFTTNFDTQLSPVAIKRPRTEDPYTLQNEPPYISQTQFPSIPQHEPSSYTLQNEPDVDLEPQTLDLNQSMVDSFDLAPNEFGLLNPVIRLDRNNEKPILDDVETQVKNRLPLKKRCISTINETKPEDSVVSYPSTPMKSIAEFVSMHDHFVYLDNNNSKHSSSLHNENRSFISEYYASVSSNDQLNHHLPDNLIHSLNDMFSVAQIKDANNLSINIPPLVTEFSEDAVDTMTSSVQVSKPHEIKKEEQIGDDLQVKPIRLNCRRICNIPLNIIGDVLTEITSTSSSHASEGTVMPKESDQLNTNHSLVQFENQSIPDYTIQNLISPTNTTDFCNSAPETLLDYYDNSGGNLTLNTSPDVLVRTSVQSDMNNITSSIIKPEFTPNTFQLNNNSYEQLSPCTTKRPRNENWMGHTYNTEAEPRINVVPSELEVKTIDFNSTIWSKLTAKEHRLLNPVIRLKRVPIPPESSSNETTLPEDEETQTTKHLPLKKRRVSTLIKDDDVICYPSTRMKSIAEFVNVKTELPCVTNTSSRIFKTPAELKEVPPLPASYLINTVPNDVFAGNFYTNPVYNYNVPALNFPYLPQYLIPPLAPIAPNFYMSEALPNYSYINIPRMPFGACPTTLNPTRSSRRSKETQKSESFLT